MEIVIDTTAFVILGEQGPLAAAVYFFTHGGWIFFIIVCIWGFYHIWLLHQQGRYASTIKWTILAIDIPKDTEQTPKAVEQLFATISGAHTPLSAKEKYLKGMFQLAFAFEIVSIDGYVQYLIRTPSQLRDLVESAIFSQYPDAEITEVEDYVDTVPTNYPNDTHNIWGAEIILANDQAYPIKTHPEFEDKVTGELKDPVAALLETLSKIKKGEQVWLQILVKPTDVSWSRKSEKLVLKLAGRKPKEEQNFFERLLSPIFNLFFLSSGESMFYPIGGGAEGVQKQEKLDLLLYKLTPGEIETIKAIERKAGQIGFECKMRFIYSSPLELYSSARVVSSVFGAIKQFNTHDLNAFKPDARSKTKIEYFMINYRTAERRRRLMNQYKNRSSHGRSWFILNIEELASIWHFPTKFTHAPLVQKTEAKKAEAPTTLPIESTLEDGAEPDFSSELRRQLRAPSSTEPAVEINYDNDYFEQQFAKPGTTPRRAPQGKGSPPANLPT